MLLYLKKKQKKKCLGLDIIINFIFAMIFMIFDLQTTIITRATYFFISMDKWYKEDFLFTIFLKVCMGEFHILICGWHIKPNYIVSIIYYYSLLLFLLLLFFIIYLIVEYFDHSNYIYGTSNCCHAKIGLIICIIKCTFLRYNTVFCLSILQ